MPIASDFTTKPYKPSWGKVKLTREEADALEAEALRELQQQLAEEEATLFYPQEDT